MSKPAVKLVGPSEEHVEQAANRYMETGKYRVVGAPYYLLSEITGRKTWVMVLLRVVGNGHNNAPAHI